MLYQSYTHLSPDYIEYAKRSAWSFVFFIAATTASDFEGFLSQILSITFIFLS